MVEWSKTVYRFISSIVVALLCGDVARGDLIAYWNFNNLTTGTNAGTIHVASAGTGTLLVDALSDDAGTNLGITSFAGSTINARGGDASGQALTIQGGTSESTTFSSPNNNGSTMTFNFNLAGFENPVLTFAGQRTSTGFNSLQVATSIDGVVFVDFGSAITLPTSYALQTFNLSTVDALDDSVNVFLRLTLKGATAFAGNNRFDNIQINATPVAAVPEPNAVSLGLLGSLGVGITSFRLRKQLQTTSSVANSYTLPAAMASTFGGEICSNKLHSSRARSPNLSRLS